MEEFQVLWTEAATLDLAEIVAYIAIESPMQARRVLSKIRQDASNLQMFPKRGRVVPELQDVGLTQWRELIVRPWRVLYRIDEGRVLVEVVLDSRRDAEALLLERPQRSRS